MRGELPTAAVLSLAAAALYVRVAGHGFVFDDATLLLGNPVVGRGLTPEGLVWAFTRTYSGNWHPLTWLSHMLDMQLFGMSPRGPHLVNVGLHALNTLLLFVLLARMSGSARRGALAALLFAVHPTRVEAVAWISERKELLAACFGLLALGAYLSWVRRPGPARYLTLVLLFALGLMAKPTLVTLPLLLLLLDFWPLGRFGAGGANAAAPGRLLLEKAPLFAMSLASSVITYLAQDWQGTIHAVALPVRAANVLVAYLRYLGKTVMPLDLSPYYPYSVGPHLGWSAMGAALVLAGVTLLVLAVARRLPHLAAGWLWYLIALVPMIGVVQVGAQGMADRYAYLPLIGLFILAAWSIPAAARRARIVWPAAAVFAALAWLSWQQVGYWKDDVTLFRRAVAVTRDNWVAHNFLGLALARSGRTADALPEFAESLRINPEYEEAHLNLGQALARLGSQEEAARQYREALRIRPDYAKAHISLSMILARQGKAAEAGFHYREALRLNPRLAGITRSPAGGGGGPAPAPPRGP